MIKHLNLKTKMTFILIIVLIIFAVLNSLIYISTEKSKTYLNIEKNVEQLYSSMLILRKHEKDFLLRSDDKYFDKFMADYQKAIRISTNLNDQLLNVGYEQSYTKNYLYLIGEYKNLFTELVIQKRLIGLTINTGLYGELRQSIQKLQNYAIKTDDINLLAKVYELRKHEKDFMLRKDMNYSDYFNELYHVFLKSIKDKKMYNFAKDYQFSFLNLVMKEQVIGLDEVHGIRGDMRTAIHKTENIFKELEMNVLEFEHKQIDNILSMVYIIAFVSIVFLLLILVFVSRDILHSLDIFKHGLLDFFDYLNRRKNTMEPIVLNNSDEFGEMVKTLNQNIKITTNFLKSQYEGLEKVANTDSLTKIYNRNFANQAFEHEIKAIKRYGHSLGVIMIDIDHFKKVNDTHGHDVGDMVLKEFVNVTKNFIRELDIFIRWGGEEFIIFLPQTTLQQSCLVAEKIRKEIENYEQEIVGKFTISLGVSEYEKSDTLDTLIKRCDVLLYKAKDSGRNKVLH